METVFYSDPFTFEKDTSSEVQKDALQNNLIILNTNLAKEGGLLFLMAAVRENGKTLLTAIRKPGLPMTVYETGNTENDEALACFVGALKENGYNEPRTITPSHLGKRYSDLYAEMYGRKTVVEEELILYRTGKINALSMTKGHCRTAEEADMCWLPYWRSDFTVACNLGGYDINASIEACKKQIGDGKTFIWEDGCPVSMARAGRTAGDAVFIGSVYTPPHYRNHGYAQSCVGTATRELLKSYATVALYADKANPVSNAVYRKIGYTEVMEFSQYKLKEDEK